MIFLSYVRPSRFSFWANWFFAVVVLLSAGASYRVAVLRLGLIEKATISLPVPLSAFPEKICNWTGKDTPIPEGIQRVASNDDFLNRLYKKIPVPKLLDCLEPEGNLQGALLMEYWDGDTLSSSTLTEEQSIKMGALLAQLHEQRTDHLGDIIKNEKFHQITEREDMEPRY